MSESEVIEQADVNEEEKGNGEEEGHKSTDCQDGRANSAMCSLAIGEGKEIEDEEEENENFLSVMKGIEEKLRHVATGAGRYLNEQRWVNRSSKQYRGHVKESKNEQGISFLEECDGTEIMQSSTVQDEENNNNNKKKKKKKRLKKDIRDEREERQQREQQGRKWGNMSMPKKDYYPISYITSRNGSTVSLGSKRKHYYSTVASFSAGCDECFKEINRGELRHTCLGKKKLLIKSNEDIYIYIYI